MSDLKSNRLFRAVLRAMSLFAVGTLVDLAMGTPLGRSEAIAAPIALVLGVVSFFRDKARAVQADREPAFDIIPRPGEANPGSDLGGRACARLEGVSLGGGVLAVQRGAG
jgi:hypothetical protein